MANNKSEKKKPPTREELEAMRQEVDTVGESLMNDFAEKHDIDMTEPVQVINEGDKVIIPQGMTDEAAVFWVIRNLTEKKRIVTIDETVQANPLDGAVAFMRVLARRFGMTSLRSSTEEGFFGKFKVPPRLIGIQIGPNEVIQVPWGDLEVPGINGTVSTSFQKQNNQATFRLHAEVERNSEGAIHELAKALRIEVREQSIYKGKAIKYRTRDDKGILISDEDPMHGPTFMDLSQVDESQAIYNQDTTELIKASLHTPVIHAARFKREGLPLKQGILLDGEGGTGKTLAAYIFAKVCQDNGWTFVHLSHVEDLIRGIELARLYQPSVLFCEDIDIIAKGERDKNMNRRLEEFDGIDAKSTDVIILCTTNDGASLNEVWLRPGRFNTIPIGSPDSETTLRLAKMYGKGMLRGNDEALMEALQPVNGKNASVVEEAIRRSQRFAVTNSKDDTQLVITSADLRLACNTMGYQLDLVNKSRQSRDSEGDSLRENLKGVLQEVGVATD